MAAKTRTMILIGGIAATLSVAAWLLLRSGPGGVDAPEGPEKRRSDGASLTASSRREPPPGFYSSFMAGGAIVTGFIAEVRALEAVEPVTKGELILDIEETLRGKDTPETIVLPFERRPSDSKRPLPWDRVSPDVGKHLCAILASGSEAPRALCVIDLEGDDRSFWPVLRRMVELETLPDAERHAKLLSALAESSPWIRALATELLLVRKAGADPLARFEVLAALAPMARDAKRPLEERLQALSLSGFKVYDGFTADDATNDEVLSLLAGLLVDPEPRIRGEAAHALHGYLLGAGTLRPSPEKVKVTDRGRILRQLKQDVDAGAYFARPAQELLDLFSKGQGKP